MRGGVVLVHPVVALLRLVECDAEQVVAEQDLGAVSKARDERHVPHRENRAVAAQFRVERQRLAEHPAADQRPALRLGRRLEALQIARHESSLLCATAEMAPLGNSGRGDCSTAVACAKG